MSFLKRDKDFWIRFRIYLLAAMLCVGAVLVGHGAWDLCVERSDELRKLSKSQYSRKIKLSARRGMIADRHGEELAVEVEMDSVYADPRQVTDASLNADKLASILDVDRDVIYKRMASKRHFVWIARKVAPDKVRKIREMKLDGVATVKESKRFYPSRSLAAQIIGFAGVDGNGLEGVERSLDEQLSGNKDAMTGLTDGRGRIVFANANDISSSVVGNNVKLTIDKKLQFNVEKELESTIRLFQGKSGHVTVMNPHTGEVLAMASYPTYNLNHIRNSRAESRRNRAVLDVYEPGSTLKVFALAAALNSGTVRPAEKVFCERGRMEFYDVILHDDHRDGWLTITQCLKRSSNICFAKMAARMGSKRLYRYLRRFGFGERTDIEASYEMKGVLPHYGDWGEFLTATISFGQGIGVTGIQMATALSAIANGGKLMKPYIVKEITNAKGEVLIKNSPTVRRRVISRRTARLVSDMMISVTDKEGTGHNAALEGYLVAGKTGTAQKSTGSKGYHDESKFVASFFGFLPADKPEIVISVVIDEPLISYYGGSVAAPAFKRIADKAMRDMGVSPGFANLKRKSRKKEEAKLSEDVTVENLDTESEAGGILWSSVPLKEGEIRTPNLMGISMPAVLKRLKKVELRPAFYGSGVAVEQIPPADAPIKEGSFVQVNFAPVENEPLQWIEFKKAGAQRDSEADHDANQ